MKDDELRPDLISSLEVDFESLAYFSISFQPLFKLFLSFFKGLFEGS